MGNEMLTETLNFDRRGNIAETHETPYETNKLILKW